MDHPMSFQRDCLMSGCPNAPSPGSALCPEHNQPWPAYVAQPPGTDSEALPDRPYYVLPDGQQVKDVVGHLSYNVGTAVAYLFRAGRKPGNPAADDIRKARDHLMFELVRLEGGK
jgi:hypothetical protein